MFDGNVIGIGVDLCAVSRMEKSIQRAHFVERVFLPGERAYLEGKEKSRAQKMGVKQLRPCVFVLARRCFSRSSFYDRKR